MSGVFDNSIREDIKMLDEKVKREYGEIKMYNKDRGFGFIILDSVEYCDDVFFHISKLAYGVTIEDLQPGTKVSFELIKRPKGMNAADVGLVDNG